MEKVTTITINTDASFNEKYKLGGYAFYIICDRFKAMRSGSFKVQPKSSIEAEVMAIGNAFSYLLKLGKLPKTKWLIINSDCIAAMKQIKSQKSGIGKEVHRMWQRLMSKTESKKSVFRHVKAHNNKDDARTWVNTWCDREARFYMREKVKEVVDDAENRVQQHMGDQSINAEGFQV